MARYIVETLDGELTIGKGVDGVKIYPFIEWVSVKSKMPIDGSDVMFCDIDGNIYIGYHIGSEPRTHFVEKGSWEKIKNVVAWKPLPTPYVESEDEE